MDKQWYDTAPALLMPHSTAMYAAYRAVCSDLSEQAAFLFMRPEIVTIGTVSPELVAAIERDITAGLVPQWIGAVVISGCAIAFVERWKWIQTKIDRAVAKN